jgi:L-ascorbate metabolism protein UlaG (beta-lactamase superfamily)
MRLTKFGHACVRIEHGDATVVVDPGMFTEPEAVDGATAVLVTHEHPDHWTADRLARADAPIFTISAVAAQLPLELRERVTVVTPGSSHDVGVPMTVVGEKHAVIHPELPHCDHSGYLLTVGDTSIFHPGDALTVPDEPVDVLLLPVSAPWLKISEAIDYGRAVRARRHVAARDAVHSGAGLAIADAHLQRFLAPQDQEYVRLAPGADL